MYGIIDIDFAIIVNVTITDISGHQLTVLISGIGNLGLIAEQSLVNIPDRLRQFVADTALPFGFVGSFFQFLDNSLCIGKRAVQDNPKVGRKGMLYLARKIDTPRPRFTDIGQLKLLNTHIGGNYPPVVKNVMTHLLINIKRKL